MNKSTVIKGLFLVPMTLGIMAKTDVVSQHLNMETTVSAATTSSDMIVDQSNRDDGFWTKPYGQSGAEYIGSMKQYNGKTGYVDVNAFADIKRAAIVDTDASKYQVTFNIYNGGIWSKPYGVSGAQQVGKTNGDTRTFQVDKIAKVVYRGGTTLWVHLQNYGWVDKGCTRAQINMSEVDPTLYGRYGILPRNFDVFAIYGSQLQNANTDPADELYY